jgi:carboxymethylenebutenolidase
MGPPHQPDPLGIFPERFKTMASLFGTRLITDDEDSVHHCVPTMQGEVYCGFTEHDPSAPLPMVEEFTNLLERCAVTPLVEVHPGTVHGYAFPGRIVYYQDAAERSWARIFAMFERQIAANPSGCPHNPGMI